MRHTSELDALWPATRKAVLTATLMQPHKSWYLTDLARHLEVRPSSLQRELAGLVRVGILKKWPDGNRVYYQPDHQCPFLPELSGLVQKTSGLLEMLRALLAPFTDSIEWAFLYGSVARGEQRSQSDVDLIVIGEVRLADLASALRAMESRIGREINASVFSRLEFAKKLKDGNHFLRAVMAEKKTFVLGEDDDLAAIAGAKSRSASRHKSSRT